jgi:2-polyprenyl-3-methyl-5-hydroxy-6-metoxy-1,4-benzoquinol methylase
MNEFDSKAPEWDNNPMHTARSKAVSEYIRKLIPLDKSMKALEFGAGTGSTSVFLSGYLGKIIMTDTSAGMVDMMKEKISRSGITNLEAILFDLQKADYPVKFDLIYTQMVLHHIPDTDRIIQKFAAHLNPGGWLAIADLYSENGSFHGEEFTGHKGFDPEYIEKIMIKHKFAAIRHMRCFTIEKQTAEGLKNFDVFIITGQLKSE